MNHSPAILLGLYVLTAALIDPASAQPVAANSTATLVASTPAVSIFILPDGSGSPLSACYGSAGTIVSAAIEVTLIDANGLAATNVSERDIRLAHAGTNLGWCADSYYPPPIHAPNCADVATNSLGQTTFTMAYHGGGWHQGPMQVFVLEASGNWEPIPSLLLIYANSPDYNGDLAVDLSDVAVFAQDIGTWPVPHRSDFNWDGIINLADIAMFSEGFGMTCP